ncbi:DUF4845 domain-containing protein [Thiohalophilus sp.]|uniref:DUF4845 domain-containing protein n=1 Tax=Thiohalophilus sp. TaxID=3028392 RepID=UPI002ACDBBF1|nr:DUF4845 domain-containing protein [Thiohalophilus sp.]MDZ7663128.1 DUF4845 domain-containing protein [Thiohalophilus sp.]
MNSIGHQKGVSALGWILILALITFFSLVALKLAPLYINSLTVSSILSDIEKEPSMGDKTPAEILETLNKRLSVNMIKYIRRDEIYIENTKDNIILELDYEVREDFVGNIDIVVSFNKRAEIPK